MARRGAGFLPRKRPSHGRLADCPYFNPMVGDLDSVSECLVTTFKKLENEQQTFFANMDEMLMRRCIKVTK